MKVVIMYNIDVAHVKNIKGYKFGYVHHKRNSSTLPLLCWLKRVQNSSMLPLLLTKKSAKQFYTATVMLAKKV